MRGRALSCVCRALNVEGRRGNEISVQGARDALGLARCDAMRPRRVAKAMTGGFVGVIERLYRCFCPLRGRVGNASA